MIHSLNLYDSKKSNLPYNGWIKLCVICSRPTSNFITEKYSYDTKYKIYVCYECKKKKINLIQIKKNLDNLIMKSYQYRFKD